MQKDSLNIQENSTPTNRIEWIDTAKFIGIFFVILGHIPLKNLYIQKYIYTFHMPLFFFLSGMTFHSTTLTNDIKKAFKHIIVPYYIYSLICLTYWFIKSSFIQQNFFINNSFNEIIIKPINGIILGCGFDTNYSTMLFSHLWFLPALFGIKIISSALFIVLEKIKDKKLIYLLEVIFTIICITLTYILHYTEKYLPFSLGSSLMAFPFFLLGNNLKHFILSLRKKTVLLLMLLTGIIFNVLFIFFNNSITDINTLYFACNPILFYTRATVGSLFIITLSIMIKKLPSLIKYLSRNTIDIFAFHPLILEVIFFIISKLTSLNTSKINTYIWGGGGVLQL